MKRKYIKIIIQSFIIFTCFITSFLWLDRLTFPLYSEIEIESKNFLLDNQEFSILIMGNSHAVDSYIPSVLNDISIDENYLNFSTAGAGFNSLYFYLKNALQKGQKPDLILLETYAFRFDDYDQSIYSLKGNNYLRAIFDILKYIPEEDHQITFSSLFMNYNTHDLVKTLNRNLNYIDENKDIKNQESVISKGYKVDLLLEPVPIENYNAAYQFGPTPLDISKYNKIFEQFLKLCTENKIEVILLRSPSVNIIEIGDQYTSNLATENNLQYIDLNKEILDEIDNPRYIFFDAYVLSENVVNSHTNHYGAQYASLKLAQKLDELGYIDIDQNKFQNYWNEMQNSINLIEE